MISIHIQKNKASLTIWVDFTPAHYEYLPDHQRCANIPVCTFQIYPSTLNGKFRQNFKYDHLSPRAKHREAWGLLDELLASYIVVQTSLFAPFFDTGRQKILDIKYDGMHILSQKPYFFANLPQPYAQFRLGSPSVQLFALQKKDSVFIFC